MIAPATPALTTVRGFQGTPVTSGDEDSDYGARTPVLRARDATRRGRKKPAINDVVSAHCSPVLKPTPSPAVSGIAKLRMQLEPLSLDSASSSRASSMTRSDSRQRIASPLATPSHSAGRTSTITSSSTSRGRTESSNLSSDETVFDMTTSYEISLENDFTSESVRDRNLGEEVPIVVDVVESVCKMPAPHKMTARDFEPLRCLGKGNYGTVLLVKKR